MTEEFLQYVWKYQLFDKENLITSRGENIEIIFPGMQNNDSGPDFTGSKIKIDGILWVGNIEVHLNSSDWYSHGHDRDKAYDNVILHVVLNDDIPIKNSLGNEISSIKIEIKDFIVQNYKKLIADSHPIACHELIPAIDRIHFVSWLSKLTVERLMNRAIDIDNILKETNNSIENAFYIYIAKSFGFKVNSQPFEMLARSLPLNLLSHYKNNLFQIEALIIGQSGYLEDNVSEKYFNDLKNEYSFLKKKHSLIPLKKHVWKTMRLRPSNFPLIRLAQFAALIHKSSHLFSKIIESESVNDVERLFEVTASEYWDSHYNFEHTSRNKKKRLSKSSIHLIIINGVIPFIFVYGKNKDNEKLQDKALKFAEQMPSEKNKYIEEWNKIGIRARDSFESQGLLQLRKEYCNKRRCIDCSIGNIIISKQYVEK